MVSECLAGFTLSAVWFVGGCFVPICANEVVSVAFLQSMHQRCSASCGKLSTWRFLVSGEGITHRQQCGAPLTDQAAGEAALPFLCSEQTDC